MTQGTNQQLKAKSMFFENNVLDDLTGSKCGQRLMNSTGQPSAHQNTMSHLVISLQMLSSLVCLQRFRTLHRGPKKARSTLVMSTLACLRVCSWIILYNHSY